MEEKDLTQEFDLDEILNEFHDLPEESPEEVEADQELKALLDLPEAPAVEIPGDTGELPALENKDAVQAPAVTDDVTLRFEIPEKEETKEDPAVSEDATVRMDPPVEATAATEEFLPPPPLAPTPGSMPGITAFTAPSPHCFYPPFPSAGTEKEAGGRSRKAVL